MKANKKLIRRWKRANARADKAQAAFEKASTDALACKFAWRNVDRLAIMAKLTNKICLNLDKQMLANQFTKKLMWGES